MANKQPSLSENNSLNCHENILKHCGLQMKQINLQVRLVSF